MGVMPLTFQGTTSYSSDFQAILSRAVNIANIPLQQVESQDTTVLSKKTQLGTLEGAVQSMTTAVQNLGLLAAGKAITATSSNTAAITASATGVSSSATYTINSITSLAVAATERSESFMDATTQAVTADPNFKMSLVVGGVTYHLQLTATTNNLNGLVAAIGNAGAGVTASILTTGDGDYLSVSADNLGATTLGLYDGTSITGTDLLTNTNQGSDAVFYLGGLKITRTENTINDLIAGVALTLVAPSNSATTVTLGQNPSQISAAIQTMVKAYNTLVTQVNGQTGPDAGVLLGDPALLQLESAMRQITNYQVAGPVKNLADMGVNLNSDGTMSFDSSVFDGLSSDQVQGMFTFFGSATAGFGGLSQTLSSISDPLSGAIAVEQTGLTQTDVRLQKQITTITASINAMQNSLYDQLSLADALIATLNSQQNMLTASIESLDYVLYGKQVST